MKTDDVSFSAAISGGLHAQDVDYERFQENGIILAQYSITVSAADSGSPAMTCSASFTVTIEDVNDNHPTAPNINVNVPENSNNPPTTSITPQIPSFVTRVVGTDVDTGLGGSIRYRLIDGNIGNAFEINELDGVVSVVNAVIDREVLDEYTLTIELRDLGDPSLTSTSMVSCVNVTFTTYYNGVYFCCM